MTWETVKETLKKTFVFSRLQLLFIAVAIILGTVFLILWPIANQRAYEVEAVFDGDPERVGAVTADPDNPRFSATSWEGMENDPELNITFDPKLSTTFVYRDDELLPVRNQGRCGYCWAYAFAQTLADIVAIHSKGEWRYPLSIQQILSCSGGSRGCDGGGYIVQAINFAESDGIVREMGIAPSDVPCDATIRGANIANYRVFVDPESRQHAKSISNMRKYLYLFGPMIAKMRFYGDFTSGVWYSGQLLMYDPVEPPGHAGAINHSIEVIGYNKPNPDDYQGAYWVCRNSWGSNWGQNGRFLLPMGKNAVGIEEDMHTFMPIVVRNGFYNILSNMPSFIDRYEKEKDIAEDQTFLVTGVGLMTAGAASVLIKTLA